MPAHHANFSDALLLPLAQTGTDGIGAQIGDIAHGLSAPQALGSEAHLVAGVGLVAGLVLWLFGSRVLRPMFALLGAAVGAFLGLVLVPLSGLGPIETGWDVAPSVSPEQIGLLGGAVLGVVLAFTLYRAVMALGSGFVFAGVGLLAGLIYIQRMPDASADAPQPQSQVAGLDSGALDSIDTSALKEASDWLSAHDEGASERSTFDDEGRLDVGAARAKFASAAERSRVFIDKVGDSTRSEWETLSPRQRVVMLGAALVGLATGLLFGMTMPTRSAALMTAMAGSGVAIGCGLMLAESYDVPRDWLLNQRPSTWAILWGVAAAVGLTFQMTVARKSRHHHHDDDEDDDD
ncbi:MAG: hypothetical protein R3B57_03310 [Phycisphaerales bacterium]